MNGTLVELKPKSGERLTNAKRLVVISKLADYLTQGYYSTNELSKMTGLSRKMIDTYRPAVDDIIGKQKLDRNIIRSLQLKRTYTIIEMLMKDLDVLNRIAKNDFERAGLIKQKTLIYNQIAKFSSHLALITGLNVETHVNVDQQQLVIIRADNGKKPSINETQDTERKPVEANLVTISESAPENIKQGHSIT